MKEFFTTLGLIFQTVLVIWAAHAEKNKELKQKKVELNEEWLKLHQSGDIAAINSFLQRLRE